MKTTTVRALAQKHPEMYDYYYKWRDTENPELEKNIEEVLAGYGYQFTIDSKELAGEYNDIKGYLNCRVQKIQ